MTRTSNCQDIFFIAAPQRHFRRKTAKLLLTYRISSSRSTTPNSMSQTQFAPAATAGGQQNGPVSCTVALKAPEIIQSFLSIDTAIDNNFTLHTQLTPLVFSLSAKTAAPRQLHCGDEMKSAQSCAMPAVSFLNYTAVHGPFR